MEKADVADNDGGASAVVAAAWDDEEKASSNSSGRSKAAPDIECEEASAATATAQAAFADERVAVGAAAAAADSPLKRRWRRNRRKRKAGEHHQPSASGRRQPWKPYMKMTWEERLEADERVTLRANRRRDQLQASGQAMAPYNTTQFLMEQHEPTRVPPPTGAISDAQSSSAFPYYDVDGAGRSSGSLTGESSVTDIDDAAEVLFLEREFAEEYESFQAERLQTLTKDELIREYVEMEKKLERLQQQGWTGRGIDGLTETQRLAEENTRLSRENDRLRAELAVLISVAAKKTSTLLSSDGRQ
jgi:hypothetical protein